MFYHCLKRVKIYKKHLFSFGGYIIAYVTVPSSKTSNNVKNYISRWPENIDLLDYKNTKQLLFYFIDSFFVLFLCRYL